MTNARLAAKERPVDDDKKQEFLDKLSALLNEYHVTIRALIWRDGWVDEGIMLEDAKGTTLFKSRGTEVDGDDIRNG